MAAVSRDDAIAPPWQLLPAELDRAFQRRFGRPETPLRLQPFGWGMRHRAGIGAPELAQDVRAAILRSNPELSEKSLAEWIDAILLAGPPVDLPVADIAQPPLQFAEGFAREENEQLQRFLEHGSGKDERRRGVAARMMLNLLDPIHEAGLRARVSLDDLLKLGADGLIDFMLELPSQAGALELTWLQHDNAQTRWEPKRLERHRAASTPPSWRQWKVAVRHDGRPHGAPRQSAVTPKSPYKQEVAGSSPAPPTTTAWDAAGRDELPTERASRLQRFKTLTACETRQHDGHVAHDRLHSIAGSKLPPALLAVDTPLCSRYG
jgi:hypothetical protein